MPGEGKHSPAALAFPAAGQYISSTPDGIAAKEGQWRA
jgi:hypothetical protein